MFKILRKYLHILQIQLVDLYWEALSNTQVYIL
jgi:hypothetical protein